MASLTSTTIRVKRVSTIFMHGLVIPELRPFKIVFGSGPMTIQAERIAEKLIQSILPRSYLSRVSLFISEQQAWR
jgi:hypothetical protein